MKKDELVYRRIESLVLSVVWLGQLANKKMLKEFGEKRGMPNFKEVHFELFGYIDPDGTTITEIARRKGVTKQSISKTVMELIDMGFLEARENPQDSRSKLISFNLRPGGGMLKGFEVLAEIDESIAADLGASTYKTVLSSMQKIIQKLETENPGFSIHDL